MVLRDQQFRNRLEVSTEETRAAFPSSAVASEGVAKICLERTPGGLGALSGRGDAAQSPSRSFRSVHHRCSQTPGRPGGYDRSALSGIRNRNRLLNESGSLLLA